MALAGAMLPAIPEVLGAAARAESVLVMHTNDFHSRMDPFPDKHPKFGGQGGIAKLSTLIHGVRQENKQTLLLDCGDIFQGTPYFNVFGGVAEIQWMNQAGYDAGTLGNHDFDNGIDGLLAQMPNAKFDFVSNYGFQNTVLDEHVKPYQIKYVDGIKIGIFGLGIELQGLVDKKNCKETVYNDPIESATDMARILKHENKCDLVICLSHIGYNYKEEPNKVCDLMLAKKTKDIDLIIGGHTHTFLDKPVIEKNLEGKEVLINQVGCYGLNLGRIDFYLTSDKEIASKGKSIVI
jgi:5'-nucleotidase